MGTAEDRTIHASSPYIITVTLSSPRYTPAQKTIIRNSSARILLAANCQRHLHDNFGLLLICSPGDKITSFQTFTTVPNLQTIGICGHRYISPVAKENTGNLHVTVLTSRYTKLTRSITAVTVTSTNATHIFVENWIMPYEILTFLLTNNGPQFVPKFFAAFCLRLG